MFIKSKQLELIIALSNTLQAVCDLHGVSEKYCRICDVKTPCKTVQLVLANTNDR